ncbi:DUF2243 domain-containing protein [Labedella phragmitis]|uniref:DUF2243 domain-containing protein n=1 Tax=Labedella phragmitis TaxID=2498849 RepID=A0A444PPC8_9MICO|nr:DUF2243 domain-containing protein [Labedella phragmitis]RWZ46180.1 DUF2243 domain-containing protein [Labedella phragmitis]
MNETSTLRVTRRTIARRRAFWATFLMGAAVMAAVDEIVFHQLLRWHHFYDRSTTDVGLVSDGVLHAAELVALVAGFFLLADALRRGAVDALTMWSGFFVGAGAFQIWDGLVDHKLLRVHQVRYDVVLLPYDVAWVAAGVVLLVLGLLLGRRTDGERTT